MKKMTEAEMKEWVDNASYAELLSHNRFAPIGDPLFQGEMGEYTLKVMYEKKSKLSHAEQVAISKSLGWD